MQINIEKRHFLIILGVMFLLAGGLVYAFTGPTGVGHLVDEIDWSATISQIKASSVCIGGNCRSSWPSAGLSSCTFQTTTSRCGTASCPSGYKLTGLDKNCDGWGGRQAYCGRVVCS